MRAALRSRLEKLEVEVERKKPQLIRCGYLKTLPTDFVGCCWREQIWEHTYAGCFGPFLTARLGNNGPN